MAPKLYLYEVGAPSRSILITAAAIGLELEKQVVDILKKEQLAPEFVKLNPQHTIPTLTDGDYVVWDSHAIIAYLVNKYAKDDSFYPKDPQKRGTVDNRLHYNNSVFFNSHKTLVDAVLHHNQLPTEEGINALKESYNLLNTYLQKTKFIAGDNLTIADFSIGATISSAKFLLPVDEEKFPKLAEWVKRLEKLPYYSVNIPGEQKFKDLILSKLQK